MASGDSGSNFPGNSGNGDGSNPNNPNSGGNSSVFAHQGSNRDSESEALPHRFVYVLQNELAAANRESIEAKRAVHYGINNLEAKLERGVPVRDLADDFHDLNRRTARLGTLIACKQGLRSLLTENGSNFE